MRLHLLDRDGRPLAGAASGTPVPAGNVVLEGVSKTYMRGSHERYDRESLDQGSSRLLHRQAVGGCF